ncbi:MAG: hypothetical protein SP1CHLAM54_00020 [Chlamydiia bacterium]|nr:hypothetical protein [Chlamydiia bacterium]MCH9614928.1 hypothetical protein [Chlamydiia bacterium]MCH9629875.1 hypothetical protein [Chlamydiia bacterium]
MGLVGVGAELTVPDWVSVESMKRIGQGCIGALVGFVISDALRPPPTMCDYEMTPLNLVVCQNMGKIVCAVTGCAAGVFRQEVVEYVEGLLS